jgi:hypothetical protein
VAGAESREGSGGDRGRRSREVSGGLVCDFQKVQRPLGKLSFPLLQRSNEKMVNMKVVVFFKLYNIDLELKFRKSKFTTL